jgi:hypothetical protein
VVDPLPVLAAGPPKIIYQDLPKLPGYLKVHGILMGLAFVVFYPLGAFLIRSLNFKGALWLHIACQMIAWVFMIIGLIMGTKSGKIIDRVIFASLFRIKAKHSYSYITTHIPILVQLLLWLCFSSLSLVYYTTVNIYLDRKMAFGPTYMSGTDEF